MKSVIFVASIAVLAQMLCFGANQWWVKPGTVNWAVESSYYNNDDPMSVSAKGLPSTGDTIFLSGTFNQTYTLNASTDPASLELINKVLVISPTSSNCNFIVNVEAGDEITLNASVTDFAFGQNDGKGQLTKTGGGTLNLFGMGKVSSDNIYSYYISIDVQGGTVRFPQDLVKANFLVRDVNVAADASLWLMSVTNASLGAGSTGFNTFDTLTGSGLVTNTCPEERYLRMGKSCEFGGTLGGKVVVNLFNPNVRFDLTGTNSTYNGADYGIRLNADGAQVGLKKLMCDPVHAQGGAVTQPSSMGKNHQIRAYAKNTGIIYLGEGGETTWMGLNAQWSPVTVDAGAKGGITFADGREWTGYYGSSVTPSEMQELILTGSNTETVVFRPYLRCWTDNIPKETADRTNCTWYVTKRGTGTWYFDTNTRTQWRGGFCLEEGTVQFDKMTEIGTIGPFGLGTMAQCRYTGRWDPASNVTYQIAFGGSTATPRFEYLGSNIVNNATRHIGLNTQGAIVATGCKRPRVYGAVDKEGNIAEADNPFGPARFRMTGVVSTGGTGEKTLVLDSATNSLPTITDISDGPYGGTVGVTKRGAGNALISGPLTFTGKLKVEKGTLYVNDGAHYRWFKFTPTLTRYADTGESNNYSTQFSELALYDKDGHRVNVGMAGEAYTTKFDNYHPYGAGRDYTILTPNQAALGRDAYKYDYVPLTYDCGNRDTAGVITLSQQNSMVSIFDDQASTGDPTTFYVYNRTKVLDTSPKSWLSVFMHVKNTVSEVSSYDFAFYKGSLAPSPYSWKFEGSVDGLNWDLLDEQTNHKLTGDADKTTAVNYWSYTNETKSAVQVAAGQVRKGWPVANAPANAAKSDLSKATLEVAAGASLVAEGDFTVGKIEVDASGNGVGTIDNFKLAPTGTLTVRNYEKSSSATVLPLAFANVDPSALADWSLTVNGRARPAGSIVVSDEGKVSIVPPGVMIIVR